MIDWSNAEADELTPKAREILALLLCEEGVDFDGDAGRIGAESDH